MLSDLSGVGVSENRENKIEGNEGSDVNVGSETILPRSGERSVNAARDIIQSQIFTGDVYIGSSDTGPIGMAPFYPPILVGRDEDLKQLKIRIGVIESDQTTIGFRNITAVRGWPGVGKTTLVAKLAHDGAVQLAFPDGVLWTTLGREPSVISKLAEWGRALRTNAIMSAQTEAEASAQLTALIRGKRMLLIIDDVWEPKHARPFMIGSEGCATLITTRSKTVAGRLTPTGDAIYKLAVLSVEMGVELLRKLVPLIVANNADEARQLVQQLDGLPLGIQVAGHLLAAEGDSGLSIAELLTQIGKGATLLAANAPLDMSDLDGETNPTVAALLQKSTELLDGPTRDCFAYLGVFAAEPATFDEAALSAVWRIADPKPVINTLVERGLIEPTGNGRFQIHSLLGLHARSFLQ